MNLQSFSTKFIYLKIESDKDFAEKFKQDLERKSMSVNLNDTSDKVIGALDEGGNIENTTSKSREILTGLNKSSLVSDLSSKEEFFSEKNSERIFPQLEEYFQKYLQQNSLENLSTEEWQKVMGNLSSEIKDIYLQASAERMLNTFSPENMDKELDSLLKNGEPLEKDLWEKGIRTPEEALSFIEKNSDNLSYDLKIFFADSIDKDFLLKNSLSTLIDKFKRRDEIISTKTSETKDLVASFPNKVIGQSGWEKLNSDDLNKLFIAEFREIDLNKLPGNVATELIKKLIGGLKEPLHGAKGKIFEKQIDVKLEKSTATIDKTLKANPAKKSKEDINEEIKKELGNLELFKNLPDDYRDILDEKLNKIWEESVDDFLEKKSKEESPENVDKISREKMKDGWDSWVGHLSGYEKDFKNADDFRKSFIKKYFANNHKEAEAYFEKHQNYAKSFEKSFQHYEKAQTSFFDKKINSISAKLSDKKVMDSIKISFKNARNNNQKREWLKYLNSHIGEYEKSIQNSAKLENTLTTGFKALENHPKIGKLREKFSLIKKSRQFLNSKNAYISPRDYENDLKKIDQEFSAIEKKDKIDRALAEKNITKLSEKDFNLNNKNIKNQTDFARSGKIKMPEYLWKEFGKEAYKQKINDLYPKYLEAKERNLKKSPSVKFAKETIKNLSHEDLDFSRDFATQQSFNRQRHLRNQVSFDPKVWELVKPDFQKKADNLFQKHQEIRKDIKNLSKGIKNLKSADLDFDKDYQNITEFSHQPEFFEFFKNQKVSNIAYDKIKNSEFTPKVLELYGDYLKQKTQPDNSPETLKSREIIENISIKDLDIKKDFANFTEFKRQPAFREKVSFSDEIWKKVKPSFEKKALKLYSEQIQVREEEKKFEKALNTLTTDDLETNFDNFAGFVKQPAMRQFFTEINISDMAYDALTDDFAVKMDELWESVKDKDDEVEFGDKDIQKIGTKHGLNFFKLQLENRENLDLKFERLDKLLTRSSSLKNFFRKQEEHLTPVFLSFLGEMNNEDFKRLDDELGTSEKSSEEIVDIFFNSPRRKYLLSEVRKNDSEAWRKLQIAEKGFEGGLDIRGIILNNSEQKEDDENFAEFDEDGNPILQDDDLEEEPEELETSEDISEEDEKDELIEEEIVEIEASKSEDEEEDDEGNISEDLRDNDLSIEDDIEEEDEVESREILDENAEEEIEEDEDIETNENVSEADEKNDLIKEEIDTEDLDNGKAETDEEDEISRDLEKSEEAEVADTEADIEKEEEEKKLEENISEELKNNDLITEEEEKNDDKIETNESLEENIEEQKIEDEDAESSEKISESDEKNDLIKEEIDEENLEEELENDKVLDKEDSEENLDETEEGLDENLGTKEDEEEDLESREKTEDDEELDENGELILDEAEVVKEDLEAEEILEQEEKEEQDKEEELLEQEEKDLEEKEELEKEEEVEKTKEEDEKLEQEEKEEVEKLSVDEEEVKSREKIMENIKQKEAHEQSVEEKQERVKEEQKMIRRLLDQERKREKKEKEGKEEVSEDGDESSLRDNMSDDLKQKKSPVNFAEIHCSGILQLGVLLSKVHTYLELLAETDISFQINLSEKEMKREVKNSREMFLQVVDFLLEKEVLELRKASFRALSFAEDKCLLRGDAQYLNDAVSQKFKFSLLERG